MVESPEPEMLQVLSGVPARQFSTTILFDPGGAGHVAVAVVAPKYCAKKKTETKRRPRPVWRARFVNGFMKIPKVFSRTSLRTGPTQTGAEPPQGGIALGRLR